MSLADLLEWFESEYVSGCQTYYSRMALDVWHEAHEAMVDELLAVQGHEAERAIVAKYKAQFEWLIARYLKAPPHLKDVRTWDGFYGKKHGLEKLSIEERACISCWESKNGVRLLTDSRSKLVVMKCKSCGPSRMNLDFDPSSLGWELWWDTWWTQVDKWAEKQQADSLKEFQ